MQYKLKAQECKNKEIIIEEKKIKSQGENYKPVKIKYRFPLKVFICAVFGCLSLAFVVLGALVLCGI